MLIRRCSRQAVKYIVIQHERSLARGCGRLLGPAELPGAAICYPLGLQAVRAGACQDLDQLWRPGYHLIHKAAGDDDERPRERGLEYQQRRDISSTSRSSSADGASQSSPELCDDAISKLDVTRTRVERHKAGHLAEESWGSRATKLLALVWSGTQALLIYLAALPGRIYNFYFRTSRATRQAQYAEWWAHTKKEAYHYWVGTKLLWADIRICSRLVGKVVRGKQLTRRERKQLLRTTADIFRLVPVVIMLIVPFLEFAIPVLLRVFPNMLPSTFENKLQKEEELKKRVSAKLEIARFLQDTVQEMAKDMKTSTSGATQASATELYNFMKRVRAGEPVDNHEIVKFAQLFNDELTLDNLDRVHLVNLCRFVGIQPFGTDAFLVQRLRLHLSGIKADDRAISEEGIDSLTEEELRSACRARGIRAPYGQYAVPFMRGQLGEWLDLSLNRALPSSLLLLSRAFTVTAEVAGPPSEQHIEGLKETLGVLPNKVFHEISLEQHPPGADPGTMLERKLEQIRREEELINEEERESAALLRADIPAPQGTTDAQQATAAAAAAAVVREAYASATLDVLEGESEEERNSKMAAAKEEKMRKVISALAVLASSSGVSEERAAFMDLVQKEIDRLNTGLQTRGATSLIFQSGNVQVEKPAEVEELLGQKRLADKVSGILQRIEKELDNVDIRIGEAMHVIDLDNDGMISPDELRTAMGFLKDQLGEDELRLLLERLNKFNVDRQAPIDVAKMMQFAREGTQT